MFYYYVVYNNSTLTNKKEGMRIMKIERVAINTAKTGAIEYSLFSAIAGIISIYILDATGDSLNTLFTAVASVLQTVPSV